MQASARPVSTCNARGHWNPFQGGCVCAYGWEGPACETDVIPACRNASGYALACTTRQALSCACLRQCVNAGAFALHMREPQATPVCTRPPWSNAQYYNETWILFTLWAVGGIFSEWRQWLFSDDRKDEIRSFFEPDRLSMYRADFFNKLDFLCFHLMLVAIMLPVWKPYEHRAKAVLWSITCILAWMRLIRALQLTKYAGLVLIMIKMADDVFKLFVLARC